MANFADILNKPAEQVKKPKPRPIGTYLAIVNGPHKQKEVNDKGVIDIQFKTMQAQADVDQAALAEAGGVGNIVTKSFWMQDNEGNTTDYALVQFLEHHLGIEKTGKSIAQMLAEAPGKQVLITLKHRIYTDKSTNEPDIAVDVGSTAKV